MRKEKVKLSTKAYGERRHGSTHSYLGNRWRSTSLPTCPNPIPWRTRLGKPYGPILALCSRDKGILSVMATGLVAQSLQWLIYVKVCGKETCCEGEKQIHAPQGRVKSYGVKQKMSKLRKHLHYTNYKSMNPQISWELYLRIKKKSLKCSRESIPACRWQFVHTENGDESQKHGSRAT